MENENKFLIDEFLEMDRTLQKKLKRFLKKNKYFWDTGLTDNDEIITVSFYKNPKLACKNNRSKYK